MNENKWWEYYAVRYLVGTIVGAGLVAFLNQYPSSPFVGVISSLQEFKDASFKDFTLFAAIGFAFCYVSSAPILTIHATRENLRFTQISAKPIVTISFLVGSIGLSVLIAWKFLPACPAAILAVVIGMQIYLLLRTSLLKFNDIEKFYVSLSTVRAQAKRTNPNLPVKEYVESYRHLREHGNAFLILVMEAGLAFVLINIPSLTCAVPVLLAWILPATKAWLLGTVLEVRLAHKALFSHEPVD
jgi:hypothetical protein